MIEIYTRDGCQSCKDAKKFLQNKNEAYTEIRVVPGEAHEGEINREDVVKKFPFAKTLPLIFEDGRFLGGYSNLIEARGGAYKRA